MTLDRRLLLSLGLVALSIPLFVESQIGYWWFALIGPGPISEMGTWACRIGILAAYAGFLGGLAWFAASLVRHHRGADPQAAH